MLQERMRVWGEFLSSSRSAHRTAFAYLTGITAPGYTLALIFLQVLKRRSIAV
jgi:hypothetical protein